VVVFLSEDGEVKLRAIFLLFNVLMILLLFFVLIVSSFIPNRSEIVAVGNVWIILLVLSVGILDFYFIQNWRLLSLLEAENWPGLLAWLENRLHVKRRLNRVYSSLLISTALSVSKLDAIKKLEVEIRQKRPKLRRSLGVALGIPILLEQDREAIARYYGPLADDPKTKQRDWAIWCRAATLGRGKIDQLMRLLGSRDISLRLLSWEILKQRSRYLSDAELDVLAKSRVELKNLLNESRGDKMLRKSRENYLISLVLSSQVDRVKSDLLAS